MKNKTILLPFICLPAILNLFHHFYFFRDKTREKIRKQNIAKGIESSKKKQKSRPPRSVAWSDKKNQKDKKKDRKDGKTKNKKRKLEKSAEVEEDNDGDDLEKDFKMLKKLKKGKVKFIRVCFKHYWLPAFLLRSDLCITDLFWLQG